MSSHADLPQTHRALVVTSTSSPPTVQTLPTPQPGPGNVIVRILAANVISYIRDIYNGKRHYPFPTPLTAGCSAIGRIAATGPDATSLKPGDLVHIDCTVRGRDDPTAVFLSGITEGFSEGSRKLMRGEWRDSTFAEYAKVPLENCNRLDEERLCVEMGYLVEELAGVSELMVPFGGLRDVDLKVGETVVVAPATGNFGQAAVRVALAMGAGRVVAMGRNGEILEKVKQLSLGKVVAVKITGDVEVDTKALRACGPVDVVFDISPPQAAGSTHLKSCILALRHGGRASLMGGILEDAGIPYSAVMHGNLTLKGKWMYERGDIKALIRLVETGLLEVGRKVRAFGLDEWDEAFTAAAEGQVGDSVVLVP